MTLVFSGDGFPEQQPDGQHRPRGVDTAEHHPQAPQPPPPLQQPHQQGHQVFHLTHFSVRP